MDGQRDGTNARIYGCTYGWMETASGFETPPREIPSQKVLLKNGRPLFGKSSDPNEFWSALMEKAYAKLFGNYQAINFGNSIDSLEDFTGDDYDDYDDCHHLYHLWRAASQLPNQIISVLLLGYCYEHLSPHPDNRVRLVSCPTG